MEPEEEVIPVLRVKDAVIAVDWYSRSGLSSSGSTISSRVYPRSSRSRAGECGCSCRNTPATRDRTHWCI
ncbi:hypothetical protein STSO111631_02785 [Stackebrandtia soli]